MKSKKYDNAHFYNAIIDELKTNSPQIFKVNSSNVLDISITAQRRRALSLAWALVASGKVKDGNVVCIIGAGFSGTAVACTLTLLCKCIVYLIDKESKPLGKFKSANYRYVSENLNINGSSDGQSNNFYPDSIPLFQWRKGLVRDVANKWIQEYYLIARQRPIIELMGVECHNLDPKGKDRVNVSLRNFEGSGPPKFEDSTLSADLVVLATGFGEETNKYGFKDYSYWNSGWPSYYQPTKKREQVLISGGGDSGLTEVLHYLLSEFEHKLIQNYRISENYCHDGLETILEILGYGELFSNIRGYDEPSESIYWDSPAGNYPNSVIKWFAGIKFLIRDNPSRVKLENYPGELQTLFRKMDIFFRKQECNMKNESSFLNFFNTLKKRPNNAFFEFIENLNKQIKVDLSKIQEKAFNYYYQKCEEEVKNNNKKELLFKEHLRSDFEITWIVRGTTLYDSSVSLPNLCFLYLIEKYSNVKIKRTEIDDQKKVSLTEHGWLIHFKDGTYGYFNRVVIRHGLTIGKLDQQFKQDKKGIPRFQDISMASDHSEFKKGKLISSSMKDDIERTYAKLCSDVTKDKINASLVAYQNELIRSAKYTAGLEHLPTAYSHTYTHKKFAKFILENIDDSGKFPSCGFRKLQHPLVEIQHKILESTKKSNSV